MKRLIGLILMFYLAIFLLFGENKSWVSLFMLTTEQKELRKNIINYPAYYPIEILNYIPNINYKGDSILHREKMTSCFNQAGYRGDIVPVNKDTSKIRILFLGESTTFLEGGTTLESTYPEIVKSELLLKNINCNQIEIINAGLNGSMSADILNHYLYKYRYYHPDYLVIHSGFNDCDFYLDSIYSLDYSHLNMATWVDQLSTIEKYSMIILMSFKPTAYLTQYYLNNFSGKKLLRDAKKQRGNYPVWQQTTTENALFNKNLNAFYNNIYTLAQNAYVNNTQPILVQMPFPRFDEYYNGIFGQALEQHNHFVDSISQQLNIPLVKLQDMNIPDSSFMDIIHVDSIGNYLKGKAVAEKIYDLIKE